jgi:hypothetical protein
MTAISSISRKATASNAHARSKLPTEEEWDQTEKQWKARNYSPSGVQRVRSNESSDVCSLLVLSMCNLTC